MLTDGLEPALSTLTRLIAAQPELADAVRAHFRGDGDGEAGREELPGAARAAAEVLRRELPERSRSADEARALVASLDEGAGAILVAWCAASASRRDVRLAPLLSAFGPSLGAARIEGAARARVVEGPLRDALLCAPLLGDGAALASPANAEARARLEILIWEAGASALEVPELGPWIWGTPGVFDAMIAGPAHGALRGRVLAARCLEVSVRGMPAATDPELLGRTLGVLQPLLLHPEPLVWVHAARALGRLTGVVDPLEGMLLDWVFGSSVVLRQRATTAFASLPGERIAFYASQIEAILGAPDGEDWVLAAVAAATPYLFFEGKALWYRLARRVIDGDGGAVAARALARGLAALFRRGVEPGVTLGAPGPHAAPSALSPEIEGTLRVLRDKARHARVASIDESRRWIEVIAVTDVIERAERDPLDLELGLENLVRLAAQYDDEEADARAARFAAALAPTFREARRIALGSGKLRRRAAALNALEGNARALALRLWGPLIATRPAGTPVDEPKLDETWQTFARAPAEILDLVAERRRGEAPDASDDLALEIAAIRLGGYALDACGEDGGLGPGRGPTAHDTCRWLRKLDGLADGSRELPPALQSALSALLWRLVDTTRGTALGEVDDARWLGPFAAWWALVIDHPAMLLQLATALPMMADGVLPRCCEQAEGLRTAVSSAASDAGWAASAAGALAALHAEDTELSRALLGLATTLEAFSRASGPRPDLEASCVALVVAGERLQAALADPVKGLHAVGDDDDDGAASLTPTALENAPRVAALVARAIRARDFAMLDVWFAALGPVASALLEGAVRGAIRRTPPPPPNRRAKEPRSIEGYELVKPLGEGGIGTVWLVRRPGADRLFVLKIPKAEALSSANEGERAAILASFVEEANALAGLYHPNVANIIDRGVSAGVPFLVLEYLIGADLRDYAAARPMTLFELGQVVLDTCAGLASLHGAGLVHRDIKPANLWLRLPLAGNARFDPAHHRDPARVPPLATVVIDFGMVRAIRVPAQVGGRFVAGTPGYIAPEQVLDPVELDPRADVYALAATVYNATTGRSFFDELTGRDRIFAHMQRDPFDDPERLRGFPAEVAKLLRAAAARDPGDRPSPGEFGRDFTRALWGDARRSTPDAAEG